MTYLKHISQLSIILLGILTNVTIINAQTSSTVKEVLAKVTQFYKSTDQYQIDIEYNMHRGLTGNNITESYKGSMLKKGDITKVEALGSQVLHFDDTRLIVDANKKVISYEGASKNTLNSSPLDVSTFLEYYDQSQIIDKGATIICEMISGRKNFQLPYGKVVLHIKKEDYSVVKQELFFSNLIPFVNKENKKKEQDYGRLIILLQHDFNRPIEAPQLNKYIAKGTDDKPFLQEAYKQYRLIDQTEYKNE